MPSSKTSSHDSSRRRVLIVDDHPVVRRGLAQVLNGTDDLEACGEAESAADALKAVADIHPDVAVVDLTLKGKGGLELYVMCEIPANVILAEEFAEIFDGFSIGSNDLTQLILGLDRDSEIVAHLYDERNAAVKRMVADVIRRVKKAGRKIGICGQAPSDYPEFAEFLVECGIDSISLNPDTVLPTTLRILELEKRLKR